MKLLASEVSKLLDKLYNLRGEESVILSKMESERVKAQDTKERTEIEKKELQEKIENLKEEERVLKEEGDRLIATLSKIKTEDFKTVLDKLNVDFNPDKISEEVNDLLPKTIDKVKNENKKANDQLTSVETEMNTAIATIEELVIRKDEALANQTRLNEYFDLALNGNINITRDSITSLLEKFDFTEDEQREAAKILMFPEDALYDYEKKLKNPEQTGKSISDVFQEAKDTVEDTKEEEKVEHSKLSPKEELIEVLKDLDFDYLDFTNNDLEKILVNYNEDLLRKNVVYAVSKGIKLDIFIDNVELLYDRNFVDKFEELISIGKEPNDIYLNPEVLIKNDYNELKDIMNGLKEGNFDLQKVPLITYQYGIDGKELRKEINLLNLSEDESRKLEEKFLPAISLVTSDELSLLLAYFEQHGVKMTKAREIKILCHSIEEVKKKFDIIGEIHETDVYKSNPEYICKNVLDVYRRIQYCKQIGKPYKNEEGNYESFLFSDIAWHKEKKEIDNVGKKEEKGFSENETPLIDDFITLEPINNSNNQEEIVSDTSNKESEEEKENIEVEETEFTNPEKDLQEIEEQATDFANVRKDLEEQLKSLDEIKNSLDFNLDNTSDEISFNDLEPESYGMGRAA